MGYAHMFYAVDLNRLRSIAGSKDLKLIELIRQSSDSLEQGEVEALRQIIMGDCRAAPNTEHWYGYALKALCEHIGESVGAGDVAAVRDHPYKSKLVASGPPINIPFDRSDFPEIGYLEHSDIAREYKLATETKPRARRTLAGFILRKLTGGLLGREPSADAIAEDMAAYAEILKECQAKNRSLVSFRH